MIKIKCYNRKNKKKKWDYHNLKNNTMIIYKKKNRMAKHF